MFGSFGEGECVHFLGLRFLEWLWLVPPEWGPKTAEMYCHQKSGQKSPIKVSAGLCPMQRRTGESFHVSPGLSGYWLPRLVAVLTPVGPLQHRNPGRVSPGGASRPHMGMTAVEGSRTTVPFIGAAITWRKPDLSLWLEAFLHSPAHVLIPGGSQRSGDGGQGKVSAAGSLHPGSTGSRRYLAPEHGCPEPPFMQKHANSVLRLCWNKDEYKSG